MKKAVLRTCAAALAVVTLLSGVMALAGCRQE